MSLTIITRCPNCGSEGIEQDHNFCSQCRYDLRHHKAVLACCEKEILIMHDGFNYCPFCGVKDPFGTELAA